MAATAWHLGTYPGRVPFLKALRLCLRSVTQRSFPWEHRPDSGVAARTGLVGPPPQFGPLSTSGPRV